MSHTEVILLTPNDYTNALDDIGSVWACRIDWCAMQATMRDIRSIRLPSVRIS